MFWRQRMTTGCCHQQVDNFRRQFDHMEAGGQGRPPGPNLGQATSLPRERVREFQHEAARYMQARERNGTEETIKKTVVLSLARLPAACR